MNALSGRFTSAVTTSCLLAATVLLLNGCSRSSIIFLDVPPASSGGGQNTSLIRGKVIGQHSGRHIVLYALADGRWWVQPFASKPRTEIQEDGSWSAQIHLGTQYAAILTNETAPPPQFLEALPIARKTVEAVAVIKASGKAVPLSEDATGGKPLRWSGLDWQIRTIPGDYGTKSNDYSPDNVSVDATGNLHLRFSRSAHGWVCAELHSVRSFGYGTYTLRTGDAAHLEPSVMFSTFTYLEHANDGDHRELAIHITRRGVPSNTNAEFTIQPSFVPTNFYHFDVPPGPLELGLDWHPDKADFSISRGDQRPHKQIVSWLFRTGVPRSDDARLYLNLCNYGFAPIPPTHDAEVVLKSFEFYP